MNDKLENLMYTAGLTAQGCWDNMDEYDQAAIQKFAELIVAECIQCGDLLAKHYIDNHPEQYQAAFLASIADYSNEIKKHFGLES